MSFQIGQRYRVQSAPRIETNLEILRVDPQDLLVLITTESEMQHSSNTERMTYHLMETCVRTGYLTEIAPAMKAAG